MPLPDAAFFLPSEKYLTGTIELSKPSEMALGIYFIVCLIRQKGRKTMYAIINLEGRLVTDPEIKTGHNDREFCTFRVAVNQQLGAQENASFYTCTGNELIANRIKKASLAKGRMIHVTGKLTLREYKPRDQETRVSADVGILDWNYVGTKPKSEEQTSSAAPVGNGGTVNQEKYVEDPDDLPL